MAPDLVSSLKVLSERADLRGMRVLVRAGVDVPISDEGEVVDDFRLRKALPTLKLLRAAGARVIVIGHTSHADGSADVSLEPVCTLLNTYIPVTWMGGKSEAEITEAAHALKDGELMMLENVRFDPREKENDPSFAQFLASLADLYVNDSFSVSHRAHASVVGVPKYLPSYVGQEFMDEVEHLSLARTPKAPSLFVLGGAKFETKLPLVEQLLPRYDRIFIGGALANNFFVAHGYEVGDSLVSKLDISTSELFKSPKVMLPIDVLVASGDQTIVRHPNAVLKGETIFDVGPETLAMLREEVGKVATILWNGPLGDYEHGYDEGTKQFASMVADSRGVSIVGGGDTVASVKDASVTDRFTFLSTAGGAMLAFLEQGTLPGIDALLEAPERKQESL